MRFSDLPLSNEVQLALEAMGFEETTPIQEATIPLALEGRDLIAQAQTGTGKTAAFGVPLVEAARGGRPGLVLTPTRELAKQVQRELQAIAHGSPVDVVCLIGGASFHDQVNAIRRHPGAIFVATPGRVVDHLGRGTLDLSDRGALTLDEADEMLSMGFQEEVEAIVAALPAERQTLLFSATLPPAIERLAKKALRNPELIRAGKQQGTVSSVVQSFAFSHQKDRAEAVRRLVSVHEPKATLLFCRTRQRVEDLAEQLRDLAAEALHGGMTQPVRDGVMRRFREGRTKLLVATDVAARGLDVEDIELVLHDDLPPDAETYVHRVGRTGRAGRTGQSILLMAPGNLRRLRMLQQVAGRLAKIDVPTDEHLALLTRQRLVDDLLELEPGHDAFEAFASALAAGLSEKDIAVRALELLAAAPAAEPIDPQPQAGGGPTVGIGLKVGTYDGVRAGDIVGALTRAGGLRGEDVGRIDILPRMSVAEVPASEIERLTEALQRVQVKGQWLKPRLAEGWQFKPARR